MVEKIFQKKVKARKQYSCDCCTRPIVLGEEHQYETYKDGGDTWRWRSHLSCLELCRKPESGEYRASDGLLNVGWVLEAMYSEGCESAEQLLRKWSKK